ncbi:MAG: hypothetical protein C0518_06400 [Opitutus sp.]|nr:hypothetical protein [Opitutus sp.]
MRAALKVILLLAVLLALGLATLPGWLGRALKPAGARYGLTFERYERVGYARFALLNARFERRGLIVTAQRVVLDSPLPWLLRRSAAEAEITGWTLTLLPARKDASAPTNARPAAPRAVHDQLQRALAQLRTWLPRLTAKDGTINRGDYGVDVASARWENGTLRANGALPSGDTFTVEFEDTADEFAATLKLPTFAAGAQLAWSGDAVRATGTWWQQPFALDATFGERGWIPAKAQLRAENWDLPAAQLKLGAQFSRVHSNVRADWAADQFTVEARAEATPLPDAKVPPLQLTARAEGDRERVLVQALHIAAPFAQADLSAPLTIIYDGRAPATPAKLTLRADLAQQPWLADATGRLDGTIEIVPAVGESRGSFAVQLAELRAGKFAARSAALRGDWRWPIVNLAQLDLMLDDTSRVTGRGSLDWPQRELSGVRLEADVASSALGAFLPPGISFARATATVEAEGPLEAPRHHGELRATQVRASRLRPTDVTAQWQGQERALQDFRVTARTGAAALQAGGLLDERRVELRTLTLSRAGRDTLRLVAPAEVSWRPTWKITGVRLEGDASSLALDARLGATPAFFVSANQLLSDWIVDWWEGAVPPSRINRLEARGEVRDGALAFTASLDATAEWEGAWLKARLEAQGDRAGALIRQLELGDERGLMAYANGRVPARLEWATQPRVQFDENAPLEFEASIAPDSPLWKIVGEKTGFTLTGASIAASASGTLRQPRGVLRAEAEKISRAVADDSGADNFSAEITGLNAVLHAERSGLQLESLAAHIAGQPLRATGALPMDDAAWTALVREPQTFDWARATARVTAERVELAALARTFPALPFTAGVIDADLALARGELTGHARLRDGESRPLPGLGRMLGLKADLGLQGRKIEVRDFAAELGGEPVRLTGTTELTARNRPVFDLRLEGQNVPLVRRPGLLVRTNLDLRAQTPLRGPTRISGTVELRDALVMADLAAIIPGGPRGAARQPPYFSVPTEPFARWPLDVRLGGARAVRVRTAVFNGVATPQFHLTGTLGDPRAVGQLAVDEGRVIFPFANFAVQQGTVRLTEADPTQLRLAVNAAAKRMGYELRMEAGGTVASPTLTFSSNPPLESAEILLLVTTGQPPTDELNSPTGSQRLTRLGTFLGRGIFQNLTGSDEERLEITSGEQVSREGRETYRVEYKLREKLSLTGEYDEYDNYNAGIKYRLYTQEGAKREERK